MSVIVWIIFGALIGAVDSFMFKLRHGQTVLGGILTGIIGALIGGYATNTIRYDSQDGFNILSMVAAIAGAVFAIAFYRVVIERRMT